MLESKRSRVSLITLRFGVPLVDRHSTCAAGLLTHTWANLISLIALSLLLQFYREQLKKPTCTHHLDRATATSPTWTRGKSKLSTNWRHIGYGTHFREGKQSCTQMIPLLRDLEMRLISGRGTNGRHSSQSCAVHRVERVEKLQRRFQQLAKCAKLQHEI